MLVTNREIQRSGYDSSDSLCKRPAANTSTATPKYDAMLEYASALEEQVTTLHTGGGGGAEMGGSTSGRQGSSLWEVEKNKGSYV